VRSNHRGALAAKQDMIYKSYPSLLPPLASQHISSLSGGESTRVLCLEDCGHDKHESRVKAVLIDLLS